MGIGKLLNDIKNNFGEDDITLSKRKYYMVIQ